MMRRVGAWVRENLVFCAALFGMVAGASFGADVVLWQRVAVAVLCGFGLGFLEVEHMRLVEAQPGDDE